MPAQLANESFRADHVRFGNSVGAVVQVLMRSDVPAVEAFFRDHLFLDTVLANVNMILLAENDTVAGPNFGGAFQITMASIGGNLSSTDVTNLYTRLRAYMTAVGVP
jgi:hypothetical protein